MPRSKAYLLMPFCGDRSNTRVNASGERYLISAMKVMPR